MPRITTQAAADHLQLDYCYLRRLISQGRGPISSREGGRHYFEIADLDRWQATRNRLVRYSAPAAENT